MSMLIRRQKQALLFRWGFAARYRTTNRSDWFGLSASPHDGPYESGLCWLREPGCAEPIRWVSSLYGVNPCRLVPMITVPKTFGAMPRWWHDQPGREWLDTLPELVASQCRRWHLEVDGDPLHGSNALVVPVRRGVDRFVLRLSPPGDDVTGEAAALHLWAGRGTVQLFEIDSDSRALLLERLSCTRTLQSEPLSVAIPVIADLITTLAIPTPAAVTSTAAVATGHVDAFERDWLALAGPTSRAQLDTAVGLAEELAHVVPSRLAVDGDLHCEQVLAGDRAPWLIVDPVLLSGDPEYDFARVLWSRLDELHDDSDITDSFDVFVRAARVPAARARSWIVVRSMSYLLWGIPRGLTWDPPKCRRLLNVFC